ncbi:MAG: Ig-like domain-containing protein [Ignavibacteria bacterium]
MRRIKYFLILSVIALYTMISGCANQLPPSGGEDDKEPPKAVHIQPKTGTVNFSGNSIKIEFDEYVDRRSFTESFFVTPAPEGEITYDWSGKEVEINFSKKLKSNTTYLFIVGKLLKDIRNNPLSEPIQFAVSTGPKIDKGRLAGRVYSKNYERVYVFFYNLAGNSAPNPSKDKPDYIIPVNNEGAYASENLAPGNYRVFAVFDNDRNGLYDKEFESISCAAADFKVEEEIESPPCNFILKNMIAGREYYSGKDFFNILKTDSTGFIYSNVLNGQKNTGLLSRIYIHFKSSLLNRDYVSENTTLKDTLGNKIRYVNNWLNDSLLEIIPTGNYDFGTSCVLSFDLSKIKSGLIYNLRFTVAEEIKCVEISGYAKNREKASGNIVVNLLTDNKPEQNFTAILTSDSVFSFRGIIEGDYYLFAYADSDSNTDYDFGEAYPFRPSERFFFFNKKIGVKGGWKAENLIIEF